MSDYYYLKQKCAWCRKITKNDDESFGDKAPFNDQFENIFVCNYCNNKTKICMEFVYKKIRSKKDVKIKK